ncbi:MAG: DNA-binding response regulator, partial [Alphaproteobacteria bacterium]|nr:DNA-binding response regulator [Alphaproteobacteria bacterium]
MAETDQKSHILIIDDDDRLRALISRFLAEQG